MQRFTTVRAKALSKPGMYHVDVTLYLNIARGGSKSWIQRITIEGKRRDIGLGPFPVIGLAEARRRAFENRVAVASGRDPLADKRRTKVPTFREATEKTYEALRPRWRNEKVARNWVQQLERHAIKRLGDIPVDRIGRGDMLAVLSPIWTDKPETARRVRRNIKATLQWCVANGYIDTNIAGEAIDGALPAMPAVKQHYRALPYREVPEALRIVDGSRASLAAKLAFRFLVLTVARSGEARGATWAEIDEGARLWVIPATRMKGGAEHRQPLSDVSMTVLAQAQALRDNSNLIFPSPMKRAGRCRT